MSVQKVPLETIQKIRQYIKSSLSLPDSENHPRSMASMDELDNLPEPDSLSDLGDLFNFGSSMEATTFAPNVRGQWFISSTDPGAALLKLPGLKLQPEMRLVGYLYRLSDDGIGMIWAVPENLSTTSQLEQALETSGDRTQPPRPAGALDDPMEAIRGDNSAAAYVVASILQRELREFGALGKSCNWTHHRLIGAVPPQATWQWRVEMPKDFSPKVKIAPDGKVVLEFFTCRVMAPVTIYQHIDHYAANSYKANSLDRPIAIAKR